MDKITEFNKIEYKKPNYRIKKPLHEHLRLYSRLAEFPLHYEDLMRHSELMPVFDSKGKDTLWNSVLFNQSDIERINDGLVKMYQMLVLDGDNLKHLRVSSVDFCRYGNSQPFRIKIVNELNDNHDYYYIKKADASRIYGLELEHIFSPDKINFYVDQSTLVEEHIVGIPCDEYLQKTKGRKVENRLRIAKEFVKFNERCFVRLLGDMRAYNFVIEIKQDFDNVDYRLRAMDFDQQSFEGRKNMYLPQYYKDNIQLVNLCSELLSFETAEQYMKQERTAMKKRFLSAPARTRSLLRRMRTDTLSTKENIANLREELGAYFGHPGFDDCKTMGEILILHLECKLGLKIFEKIVK